MPGSRESRKPWIPPPAKTTKKVNPHTVKISESIETAEVDDTVKSSPATRAQTGQELLKIAKEDMECLSNLQQDLKLMRQHYYLLASSSGFLTRPQLLDKVDEQTGKAMTSQAVECIKDFMLSFEEYEVTLSDLNKCLQEDPNELPQFLCTCQKIKDLVILKLLNAHDCVISTLQFILDAQKDVPSVIKEHDVLKKKIEDFQSSVLSRSAELGNLEKQLSLSEMQRKSLEIKVAHLQAELSQKNSQIEQMRVKLETLSVNQRGAASNEKLIEIIEDLQRETEAEKEALKKALKLQAAHAKQSENKISNLQTKLKEKEQLCYELAADRDVWKMELTSLNNRLIDMESHKLNLEMKNETLENQLQDFKRLQKEKIELQEALCEKKSLLEKTCKENEGLKAAVDELKEKCSILQKELKSLETEYKELEMIHQKAKTESGEKTSVGTQFTGEETGAEPHKTNLCQEVFHCHREGAVVSLLERSLAIMQEKYEMEYKEKDKLQKRLDMLETSLLHGKSKDFKTVADEKRLLQGEEESSWIVQLKEELKAKDLRIAQLEKANWELELRYAAQVKELQANLDRTVMNYESLQKYVQLLKSSYTNVFGV